MTEMKKVDMLVRKKRKGNFHPLGVRNGAATLENIWGHFLENKAYISHMTQNFTLATCQKK